jgi:hypothetical protein
MATTADVFQPRAEQATSQPWLRSPKWDLSFLILSIVIAAVPYSIYLVVGGDALRDASIKGTTAYNARLFVNNLVALFIGGPHMYATFTRTIMDKDFLRKRFWFIASSILVPIAVFAMAILSYETYVWLLSIFFAMASLHALQQIIWLTGAYNRKAKQAVFSWRSSLIDYGVIFFSLYPIAVYKMTTGDFKIGPVALKYSQYIFGWTWLAVLAGIVFAVFFFLFVGKTYMEYRAGTFNVPKTLLISLTVLLLFFTPAFPNMDTAFQGINTWHSFQYLALTWYANRLRERKTGKRVGFLHWLGQLSQTASQKARAAGTGVIGYVRHFGVEVANGLRKVDKDTGWTTFYMLCLAMLPISGILLISASTFWPNLHAGMPGADEVYTYMGILSVLLVHYVHDALLFTDTDAIVE